MWIFTPQGLLMPAAVPMDKVDPALTQDGKFDFQIRGRVAEHLQNFIDAYMEEGTYNPDIQLTPEMDYNARFYTTREAFAQAMTKALMDVNYEKFKPQAYDHDHKSHPYYNCLNSIWGTVTMLGRPGGKWVTGSRYKGYTGSTFVSDTPSEDNTRGSWFDRYWDVRQDEDQQEESALFSDLHEGCGSWTDDYTPRIEDEIDDILASVEGIPASEWQDYLGEYEWGLVRGIAKARIRSERRFTKSRRRVQRARLSA